jgi:dipeptidyl aminopeptidase/acylaminoacyl peptidase
MAPRNMSASLVAAVLGLILCAVMARAEVAGPTQTPIESFGVLPTLEDVVISPDGKRLAFVKTSGETRVVYAYDLGKSEGLAAAKVGDTKLREVRWVDNDTLLATVSSTSLPPIGFYGPKREWYQMVVFDVRTKKVRPLEFQSGDQRQTFNTAAGAAQVRSVDDRTVIFVPGLYISDQVLPALFSFTLPELRSRIIDSGSVPDTDWLVDDGGRVAARYSYHDDQKAWEIKARKDGKMTTIMTGKAAIDTPGIIGFDADGTSIIAEFAVNGDWIWKPLRIKDSVWGEALDRGSTFFHVIDDRKTGRIIGGIHGNGDERYVFFDNELQAHWNAVLREFPGEKVRLASHSDDFTRMIVKVFGTHDGYVYAMFDWYSHQASILGKVYGGVAAPAPVRAIDYLAKDGMRIAGFLTLPREREPKDLPLIVLPHGGPAVADSDDFDWWAQALASQGYAVLQPNYRGSNVNSSVLEAGFGEWGRKMQTDLSDGVRDLAKQGVIDPKRVCIVGASYGGYAALAGVTLDPGVYRCAVSVAGLSDLRRMRSWTAANRLSNTQRYWDRFMGVTDKTVASLDEISPVEHISAVTVPVLLIHGRDDTVVPYEQSEIMVDALKKAGKPVEFVTLKHEDHWLSTGATRLQMLQATASFLRTNNPAY